MPPTEVEDDGKKPILHISAPTLITATTTIIANHDHSLPPSGMKKKVISYSQPLGQTGARRKQGGRNHSLDEEDYVTSAAILAVDGINSRSYQHSSSLPEEALRRHRNLPPAPNHHIHLSGGPYHHLSLERIMSSPVPTIPEEESGSHEDMLVEGANPAALPEFIGGGGGQGIFKVPTRGAVDPGRPPVLELRPHPLRETQMGSFLRTIACAQSQVWAGQESGVRVWDLEEAFRDWDDGVNVSKGDEESAPFQESYRTSATMCLVVDVANRLVWSGHKDGKIRSWKMDRTQNHVSSGEYSDSASSCHNASCGSFSAAVAASGSNFGFKEGLSWQAHRGPVLCMIFTAQGDLWSASEGGIVKVWPWESIEKSLSLSMEERHLAALLVERSCVDLRSQVTVGGVCSLPSADVRFLLSDDSRSKVWTGTSTSFALWNSLTKELIKVFNMDGQVENRIDVSSGQDTCEDEIKVKYVSTSKKEKSQLNFFQRSRNALIGAADAVRRVATKGTFGEDNRRTEVMAISMDGMIWTGCANGVLVQWDENANRLQEFQHHSSSVLSLCAFGTRLWVGYASGNIQILDLEGNLLGGWVAHSSPVIKMAVGGGYLFTLANHGGIRGWHLTSPGPFDEIMRSELTNSELLYTKFENFKILAGTWNVGQERASHDSLVCWVGSAASEADMVIIGCQEVEMGAGFLAMAAAKETVGLEGSANGHWWSDAIGKALDEGKAFDRVGTRQLAGLLISVWARKNLRKHIGDIDAGAVACGFGRAIGNKGGVGLRMRIYGRTVCLVNCHFAAHLEAVHKRNADFDHIFRTMSFSRPSIGPYSSGALASSTIQGTRGPNASGLPSDDGTSELSEADLLIFLGDFNYRLHGISYDEARDFISQRSFDWLREKDQLREEMKSGKVFQGMREGLIRFPPTYKFDRHKAGLSGYDSGEKKRIPAWCDRILYRDNRSVSLQECSLECPVVTSILKYEACMDVTDSDHKPVRCLLNVDIARSDKMVRRNEFGKIVLSNNNIKCLLEEIGRVPEIIVTPSTIVLQNQEAANILITNKCEKDTAIIRISCKGQSPVRENGSICEPYPRGGAGFPRWLEVTPTVGLIQPGLSMEISMKHEDFLSPEFVVGTPHNSTCNDTRDKEVTLLVNVVGNFTTNSISHRILVRHCFSPKTVSRNS